MKKSKLPLFRREGQAGFTLVELLIVIAIIIVLLSLLIPRLMGGSDRRNAATIMRAVEEITSGLIRYKSDLGRYPTALQPLWDRNAVQPADVPFWKGPYITTPARTSGTSPSMNVADQNIAGVAYEYRRVTTTGGTGTCATASAIGANNAGGSDHVIRVSGVARETSAILRSGEGNKICISDGSADVADVYFIVEEVW